MPLTLTDGSLNVPYGSMVPENLRTDIDQIIEKIKNNEIDVPYVEVW